MFLGIVIWLIIGLIVLAIDAHRIIGAYMTMRDRNRRTMPAGLRLFCYALATGIVVIFWPISVAEWNGYSLFKDK